MYIAEYNIHNKQDWGDIMKVEVGTVVGNLTVDSDSGLRKNRYTVWKCKCICGKEILLDTRTIQRGTVLDCGCITKVKKNIHDISNQRFGRLIAVRPLEKRDQSGGVLWECKCDCGNVCYASGIQLRKGNIKSCGCLSHPTIKNWFGKRFGKLIVIKYVGKQKGVHYWKCKCDCGKETIVSQTNLQNGHTKSCGCLQTESGIKNLKLIEGTSISKLEATNKRLYKTNTSGFNGVYYAKKNRKWIAQISFKRKTYYLGEFDNKQEAIECRKEANRCLFDSFLEKYYSEAKNKRNYR